VIFRWCAWCLAFLSICVAVQAAPKQAKRAKRNPHNPEDTIRPLRALLAISEEKVRAGSSCHKTGPKGPEQVGDILAQILAYHDSGINTITGSCEQAGDSACSVSLKHRKNSSADEEFITFRFKIADGKAQVSTLECDESP